MGQTFELHEPVEPSAGLTKPFICGQDDSAPIDIFRMLNGTVDIIRKSDGRKIKCRHNYLTLLPSRGRTSDKKLTNSLFGEDVTVGDARVILDQFRSLYTSFFIKLSAEVQHCIYYRRGDHNVESFLHFYRSLEKLAVAFPVMYITAHSDFEKIHSMLKPLFSKEGGGELSFVTKFCEKLANDSDVLGEYKVSFQFNCSPNEYDTIISELVRVLPPTLSASMTKEDGHFDLPYRNVGSFLIECRNRLFHNSNSGQMNFDIDRLGGAAWLCQGLVDAGLHWFMLTYVEVVRNRAGRLPN